MKKILLIIFLLVSSLSVTACTVTFSNNDTTSIDSKSSITEPIEDYKILIKDPYIDLYAGETTYLKYVLNFELPEGEELEFTSSDPSVARVISTGFLIAKSKGVCDVTVSYKNAKQVFYVTVNQDSSIVPPTKLTYYTDEELDLTGCEILLYNQDNTISNYIEVTKDMVSELDMSTKGDKLVYIKYGDDTYSFHINVIEREFEPYLLKTVDVSDNNKVDETVEFKLEPKDVNYLRRTVNSVYDYTEFKIVLDIETPSGNIDRIYSYYTQDFNENKKDVKEMATSRNLEGTVFSKIGYNYELTFSKNGDPYYMAKYVPIEAGTYSYTVKSYSLEDTLIETLDGEFDVTGNNKPKGVIKVSKNKRTFEFEDGETYIAVGENVAWYTSAQRRYGDYEIIFNSLSDNDCNYARIWLSGFSFSLFWEDVENYDRRLDEAYELDKVFELAEDLGIYINLTIFHHGMFSAKVNPIWPNDVNDWYINKYGANPYSRHFNNPGDFFSSSYGKKWCKNYLSYIIARYGYSNALLSYELFNEVDWVESYTAEDGALWHDEMANYIKSNDYRGHMVTTSVKGDDFTSSIYQVFSLNSIDYVNVHNYGTKNYLTTIPKKAAQAYSRFNKPIMYQEVGYNGNSGTDQINSDPDNITLHQELWAGAMSTGSTGMNWWWDSWIEKNDCYSYYYPVGKYASLMDLSGNMSLAYNSTRVTNSQSALSTIGYLFNDKAYLYVFNKNYTLDNHNLSFNSTLSVKNLDNGTYKIEFFDTFTGEITKTQSLNTSSGTLKITITGKDDVALIITKQ